MTKLKAKAKNLVPSLHTLMSYRRAHNSPGEKQYVLDHLMPLRPEIIATPANEAMAFFVRIGQSEVMFTSHTDSVHMNTNAIYQDVHFDAGLYCKKDNQPLGADDAAGNWLMFNMIHHRVPGIYAFFRGEERGGIGSSFCAEYRKDLFEGIKCAIALDRRGKQSIITHQGAGRGCSDEFGRSLASVLNMGHQLDDTGIYTDTAEFFHLVPNCTNVSVGYEREHSKNETLDWLYISKLRDSLIVADWSKLDYTPPKPDAPIISRSLFSGRGSGRVSYRDDPFEDYKLDYKPPSDITPLQIADFLFDYSDRLPRDLRDQALKLSQRIYKRVG